MTCMGDPQVIKKFLSAETPPSWTKGDRENEIKEVCQTSKILQEGTLQL